MSVQSSGGTYQSDSVIPFAPKNAVGMFATLLVCSWFIGSCGW